MLFQQISIYNTPSFQISDTPKRIVRRNRYVNNKLTSVTIMAASPLCFPTRETKIMYLFIIRIRFRPKQTFPARTCELIVKTALSSDTYVSNNRQEYSCKAFLEKLERVTQVGTLCILLAYPHAFLSPLRGIIETNRPRPRCVMNITDKIVTQHLERAS